ESWEDSEDEKEKPKPAAAAAASPVKKKKTINQKIQEKKEEEERRKAAAAAKAAQPQDEEEDDYETPEEKKLRLAKKVQESDFENMKDLFAGVAIAQGPAVPAADPQTKEEFDEYVKTVMETFAKFEGRTYFSHFVETLVRDLLVTVNVDDTRRISSSIAAMVTAKQAASKAATKKGKGAGKKTLKVIGGAKDTTNYDDVYDEFEDFM
ncbi:eukaryotic translation initiation factor 3 subunit J, partial [Blyttiomyces helicus]